MSTIGVRAAQKLGISKRNLVEIMNLHAAKKGALSPWLKQNGALTAAGRDVYQSEKAIYNVKNLNEYLKAVINDAKVNKFDEPFDRLLDIKV